MGSVGTRSIVSRHFLPPGRAVPATWARGSCHFGARFLPLRRSIGALLHGCVVERLVVVGTLAGGVGGDALGPAGWELTEQHPVLDQDGALVERLGGVQLE